MTQFHAVMIGEDGMEFGADIEAKDRNEAWQLLRENYPESRIDQLESPEDTAAREAETYARAWNDEDDEDYYERHGYY